MPSLLKPHLSANHDKVRSRPSLDRFGIDRPLGFLAYFFYVASLRAIHFEKRINLKVAGPSPEIVRPSGKAVDLA